MPIPFVVVADLRTGSTLLSTSLDAHPQSRCLGELFHSESFADNELPGDDRSALTGRGRLFALRRAQLSGKPALDIDYETLTVDWPGTIARVQEFLGLDPHPLPPAKQKQETRPLEQVITNYRELTS